MLVAREEPAHELQQKMAAPVEVVVVEEGAGAGKALEAREARDHFHRVILHLLVQEVLLKPLREFLPEPEIRVRVLEFHFHRAMLYQLVQRVQEEGEKEKLKKVKEREGEVVKVKKVQLKPVLQVLQVKQK